MVCQKEEESGGSPFFSDNPAMGFRYGSRGGGAPGKGVQDIFWSSSLGCRRLTKIGRNTRWAVLADW